MSNPRFYAGELDVCTFTMSETENALFPLSNLHSYVPSDLWISSSVAEVQTLKISFSSALYRDCIIIEGQYHTGLCDHIYLQYDTNDSASFANPVVACDLVAAGNLRSKTLFTGVTKRYWRIIYNNGGSPLATYPQFGNVFITKELDAGQTFVYPYSEKNEDTPAAVRRSVSGLARAARTFGAITRWKIVFDVMDDTFQTGWMRFYQKVIGKTPFYYYDTADAGWLVFFSNEVPLETFTYGRHRTAQLEMETQSTGQNPL